MNTNLGVLKVLLQSLETYKSLKTLGLRILQSLKVMHHNLNLLPGPEERINRGLLKCLRVSLQFKISSVHQHIFNWMPYKSTLSQILPQIYQGNPIRNCAIFFFFFFFAQAGAQIGGLQVFPVIKIKITMVRLVHMPPASTESKHKDEHA